MESSSRPGERSGDLFHSFHFRYIAQQTPLHSGTERHSGHRTSETGAGEPDLDESVLTDADEFHIAAVRTQVRTDTLQR